MQNRFVMIIALAVIVLLFGIGFFMSDQQIDVAGCSANWKLTTITVQKSDLCSAQTCYASSAAQQQNAIVDALLCACDKAKSEQYSDDAINNRIKEVVNNFFGYSAETPAICDQPGLFLVKRSYD